MNSALTLPRHLNKRKADPEAPVGLAVALGGVYIAATWGLVVLLEVWPWLSAYAPAVFPVLAVVGAPANEQDRAQVAALAEQIQEATGDWAEVAFADRGYTGEHPAADAEAHGIRLEVVKLPTAKRGFVLLPRCWVVERSFAWMARFRCPARDYERLTKTLVGLHFVAFAMLMAHRFVNFMVQSA